MLVFIACLLGQFVPLVKAEPSIKEFESQCREFKAAKCKASRAEVAEQLKAASGPNVTKELSDKIRVAAKKVLDEVAKYEADTKSLPIATIDVDRLKLGQTGQLFERAPDGDAKATLTVIVTLKEETLIVHHGKTKLVILDYSGEPQVDGAEIQLEGIYTVAGHYKLGVGTYLALRQWKHTDDYLDHLDRLKAMK